MHTDTEAAQLELAYWRALLDDVLALNDGIVRVAHHSAEVPAHCLAALTAPREQLGEHLSAAGTESRDAMNELQALYGPLNRMLAVVRGRLDALEGAEPVNHSLRVLDPEEDTSA